MFVSTFQKQMALTFAASASTTRIMTTPTQTEPRALPMTSACCATQKIQNFRRRSEFACKIVLLLLLFRVNVGRCRESNVRFKGSDLACGVTTLKRATTSMISAVRSPRMMCSATCFRPPKNIALSALAEASIANGVRNSDRALPKTCSARASRCPTSSARHRELLAINP